MNVPVLIPLQLPARFQQDSSSFFPWSLFPFDSGSIPLKSQLVSNSFSTFSQLVPSSVSVRSQLCLSLIQTRFQVVSSLFTARSQFNPSSIPARVQLVSSFFQLISARSPARFQLVSSSSPPQSQLHLSLVSALSMESKLIIQPIHYSFTLCLLLSSWSLFVFVFAYVINQIFRGRSINTKLIFWGMNKILQI